MEAATIFETKDKANASATSKSEKTVDGFQNFAAKLGVGPGRFGGGDGGCEDNLISKGHYQFNLVTRNRVQLEAAYRGAWIVGQVIDTIAEDMTRAGIEIATNDGAEQVKEFQALWSRLGIWQSFATNIKWGRLYGGSIAVLQIKGQNLSTPLDPETVGKGQFLGLSVYDRWQLQPSLDQLIPDGPEMGLPMFYDIILASNMNDPSAAKNNTGRVRVHHSRCVRSIGIQLPFWQSITEMMWGESVLERMWDRLIAFDTATMATGSLINRAQLRTVGIENMREILAAGGKAEEALVAQFQYMRMFQSSEGLTLLDKNDTFNSTAYSFAGLSDVLIQFGQQVSGAAEIPLVRLFGQSPAGMNATGESDIRLYYDGVNSKQESKMRNPVETVSKVAWRSLTGKSLPTDFSFTFTPLWQMSAKDKSDIAKANTETVIEAHQEGLVDTATAMQELKQASGDSGLFTHITDEQIEEAKSEEPPTPETPQPGAKPGSETPAEKVKAATGDSAWKRIKNWLTQDGAHV